MPDEPAPADTDLPRAAPRLTIGQRVLAALPQIRRPAAGDDTAPAPDAGGDEDTATGEDVEVPAVAARSNGTRRQAASADPKRPYRDVPSAELVHRIKYLDDRERRLAYLAAPVGVALVLAIMFSTLRSNPKVGAKNHADPTLIVMYGLFSVVMGIVVVVAARYRRRSFVTFALLFTGLGGSLITMVPMWGVAGWYFVRSSRYQRELTARGENPRTQAANARRERSAEARASRPGRSGRGARKAPAPVGPSANKRYTPPKPPRPKIPKPEA